MVPKGKENPMKLGELLEKVSIKLAGIGFTADEVEVALGACFIIADLVARHGPDVEVEDRIEPGFLPDHMPSTPLIRHLLTLPMQFVREFTPGDVVTVSRLAVLVGEIQALLDRYDLISTANGPLPRPRSI
jgi:hypothetical protein